MKEYFEKSAAVAIEINEHGTRTRYVIKDGTAFCRELPPSTRSFPDQSVIKVLSIKYGKLIGEEDLEKSDFRSQGGRHDVNIGYTVYTLRAAPKGPTEKH